MKGMDGGCCVCSDERGWDENPLVYCDGCNIAVHQACYGIVTVPLGPWFCRKCESQERAARVKCELCPSKDGAFKRTDNDQWGHVICALYIPEVRFGNVSTMEPILTSLIPTERFGRTCYICESNNRSSKATAGACMQCNKTGCKQSFHVTCAQVQGLLCEEQGNYDNVKYCGYCQYHYGRLKATRTLKIIPPFRPTGSSANSESPESSPDKLGIKLGVCVSGNYGEDKLMSTSRNGTSTIGDYSSSKKTSSSTSSPDIDSSLNFKNIKSAKKGSSHMSGIKFSDNSMNHKSGIASITPKIAQSVLAPATFPSTTFASKLTDLEDKADSTSSYNPKNRGKELDNNPKDDSFTVKLERVDNPLLKQSQAKKDYSTLQLKEVVTTGQDRPLGGSKFDQGNSGGGGSSGMDPTGRAAHHNQGDKPSLPDIKPHVTLTPIPMRGSGSGQTSSRANVSRTEADERESNDKDVGPGTKKSPVGNSIQSFQGSFGGSKLQSPSLNPQDSVDSNNSKSRQGDPSPSDSIEKAGPPAKRSRGGSREEDRERKTPTKGRGGRRGSSNPGYSKRDAHLEDNSHDDPMDGGTSTSNAARGGRSGSSSSRKPPSSRTSGRPEDPPAPRLSELKSLESESIPGTTIGALPSHMYGNALNPASAMAQRMVDTLTQEVEAATAAGISDMPDITSSPAPLIGIPLPGKPTGTTNGVHVTTSGMSSTSGGPPQTLEQLLERQWEQGSQFLMEQAQHLDIAQLLSCLNQLKQDNRALEEHVQSLVQRRDQLISINARLSVPLGNSSALGPLAPTAAAFNSNVNGTNQNGHGTPPPNLQPQGPIPHVPKGLQVNSSTPSPQHTHEVVMQSGRPGAHRDDRMYHPDGQGRLVDINVAHQASNSHGHSHGHGHPPHGRQNVPPYAYPGPNQMSHHHSPHPSNLSHHSHGRDGGSR